MLWLSIVGPEFLRLPPPHPIRDNEAGDQRLGVFSLDEK